MAICDLVNEENMEVVAMNNGVQAKSYLLDNINAPIDLILLDYNMPVMDGLEFLQWLRGMSEFKHILVLMMSTKEETNNLHYCIKQGAKNFFIKPLTRRDIKTLPRYIVEGRIKEPSQEGKKQYEKLRDLGAGANATVELVMEKNSGIEYARKIIHIHGSDESVLKQAKNEVELFKVLASPFILGYIDSYSKISGGMSSLYIIMECAKNGELA